MLLFQILFLDIKEKLDKERKIKMQKRLYKIEEGKKIDGVCGGIAEYLNVDPTLIRLAWIIFCACGGSGIIAYIIAAIIMPRKSDVV